MSEREVTTMNLDDYTLLGWRRSCALSLRRSSSMRKGTILHADAVHVRRSRSERHARKQGFACQALIIIVQRNARREPCSLRTLTPMLWLATTSIARRGTISTQRRIIATTRRHRTAARTPRNILTWCQLAQSARKTHAGNPALKICTLALILLLPITLPDEALYQQSSG